MASLRFTAMLFFTAVTLMALSDALVLCPQFPSCCNRRNARGGDSCHALCPSCREARFFENGIRKFPTDLGEESREIVFRMVNKNVKDFYHVVLLASPAEILSTLCHYTCDEYLYILTNH
ncbi:hypothetical protein SK128_012540 [Halocaridina rubra]|uniref:Uncharacterized protein n=1 Tax=Halocaridina rubra TaxID=373956 RepID=A0AAN8WWH7_HALRR